MDDYWVIIHGDPDVTGTLYWSGYKSAPVKDHTFSRELKDAIKFFDEDSAERAGLHLTKGIKIRHIIEGEGR